MAARDEFFKKFKFISRNFKENISVYYISDCKRSLGITYSELNRVSSELSAYFSRVCEKFSQYIGVSVSDYCFLPCIILAIWKCGKGFAGAGTQYTVKNTLGFLDSLQVRYLITDTAETQYDGDLLSSFCVYGQTFFIWRRQPPSQNVKFNTFEDLCYGIMTSGTTGEPKIIQVPWSCILPNAIELSLEFQVNDQDCIFQASPYSFDPFFIEILMAFLNGSSIIIVSHPVKLHAVTLLKIFVEGPEENIVPSPVNFGVENFFFIEIKKVTKRSVTILQITPSFLKRWSDQEIQTYLLSPESRLRILILGGERFPKGILKLKHSANTTRIFNIYGVTEISCWGFLNEVTNCTPGCNISLGKPLKDILFKISENGELLIGSAKRICLVDKETGFESNKPVFRNTGDVVKFVDEQLYYLNRSNEIVKKYGMKINLSKIEELFLSNNNLIKECYCVYDEDTLKLGLFFVPFIRRESVCYIVRTYEDFYSKNYKVPESELKDTEKPDFLIEISEIPLNSHGKCDKAQMLQKLKEVYTIQKPEASLESTFKRVWATALGVDKSDLFLSSFTQLGGNSVLALDIINKLEDSGFYVPQSFVSELLSGKKYVDCLKCVSLAAKGCEVAQEKFKTDIKTGELKLSVGWKFDLKKCVDASPAAFTFQGEERIVIGSHSSQLSCLNSGSGEEIWSTCLGDRIESGFTPTEDGSKGFIGCYDHFVYCLSSVDGSIVWKFKTNDMVKSTPQISSNGKFVYVGSYDKHLYCLSTADGHVESAIKPSKGSIYSSGVVSRKLNKFYTGTLDGVCISIDQDTNQITWKTALESPIFSSPCLIPNKNEILFSEVIGKVHCLNAADGAKMWTFKADGNIYSSPVVKDMNIIFGCHDSHLYCLRYEEEEPKLKWKQQLDSNVFARPAIVMGSSVCIATTKGVIYLCDFWEGSVKSLLGLQGEVFSSPVSSDNKIFVGCRDNNIYSLDILKLQEENI